MFRKLTLVACLASIASAAVVDSRLEQQGEVKKGEVNKPNIVKDYVCLRDGELCHPDYARNRGSFVSCSNGVAWEQQCPKCTYHPITCPTRNLWFDGEKCDWASPKLASKPCIDRFPSFDVNNSTRDASEHESLLNSLQTPTKDLKSSSDDLVAAESTVSGVESHDYRFEPQVEQDLEFPSYISPEDSVLTSEIVKINKPVFALVGSPDGAGKQMLMRVFQPFALEDPARGEALPRMNIINPYRMIGK